jgi:UDP-N-acetylglucosamine 3-dehydrogenase
MSNPAKVALIGAGAFGARYLEALHSLPGVELCWVCDLDEARLDLAKGKLPSIAITQDFLEACEDPAVDAVIVVTPEGAHREIAVAALERGKHVIVEKPLATTQEDGAAMLEASRKARRLLMTGFLLRFDYRYARLKQRLDRIGQVRSIYAYRNFDRKLFELYSRTHSFIENAIHDIDLILWYVPSRVTRAHGFCRNTMGRENPDVNWGVLEFENGAIATLQTTWLFPPPKEDLPQWNTGMQLMGDSGVVEVAYDQTGFRENTEAGGLMLLDHTAWATAHGEPRGAFGAMLRHYLACIRGETKYEGATPEEAMESMRIACLLVDSARE